MLQHKTSLTNIKPHKVKILTIHFYGYLRKILLKLIEKLQDILLDIVQWYAQVANSHVHIRVAAQSADKIQVVAAHIQTGGKTPSSSMRGQKFVFLLGDISTAYIYLAGLVYVA